ncbi:MAG: histidine phosphatase family protein [Myxococcota bacterium]
MRTVYFVRHGQTDWNAEGRVQGRLESTLTPLGRGQARATAERIATLGVDGIVASTALRARQSAEILAELTGLVPRYDERLVEWDAGEWSGHLYAELVERWSDAFAAWTDDPWTVPAPGGETFADLVHRGRPALNEVLASGVARVAIVFHGFIGRALLADLVGLSRAEATRLKGPNDAFFRCREADGGWRCERFERDEEPVVIV